MSISMKKMELIVPTQYGSISVSDSGGTSPVTVFIHGNSACKEAFGKQFNKDMLLDRRFIALNLPGHGIPGAGKSENARNPGKTYSLPGYSDVVIEILQKLNVQKATIVGWSLGGHIAIDLLKWSGTQGILITGTPPIPLTMEGFGKGFRDFPCKHLMGQEQFTDEEAESFITQGGITRQEAPFLFEATKKAHGLARSCLITSMGSGVGGNQQEIVEASSKPVAVVCGSEDTGINNEYIQTQVKFNNLWSKQVHFLKGGHAVFWQEPEKFNAILSRFLNDIDSQNSAALVQIKQRGKNQKSFLYATTVAFMAIGLFNFWSAKASSK